MRHYSNSAVQTTLFAGITPTDSTLTVVDDTGYPTTPFAIVVDVGAATLEEVMLVTAVAGTTWTVTRGYDGTTARAHGGGAAVIHAGVAADFADAAAHAARTDNPHATTADQVGAYTTDQVDAAIGTREPALGTPPLDGYLLSSLADGTRDWVAPPAAGGSPFVAADDADVPLISRGVSAGQTGDLQEWQAWDESVVARIEKDGLGVLPKLHLGSRAEDLFTPDPVYGYQYDRSGIVLAIKEIVSDAGASSDTTYDSFFGIDVDFAGDLQTGDPATAEIIALSFYAHLAATATVNPYDVAGLYGYAVNENESLRPIVVRGGYVAGNNYAGGGAVTLEGLYADASNYGTGLVDVARAIYVPDQYFEPGTVSDGYGILVGLIAGAANNHAIYTSGGAHRFGDYLDLAEISDPGDPTNTHARLFARDVSGVTELVSRQQTRVEGDLYVQRLSVAEGQFTQPVGSYFSIDSLAPIVHSYSSALSDGIPLFGVGTRIDLTLEDTSADELLGFGSLVGVYGSVYVTSASTRRPASVFGLNYVAYSEQPISNLVGGYIRAQAGASGTIDEVVGLDTYVDNYGGSKPAYGAAIRVSGNMNGSEGGFQSLYGLDIQAPDLEGVDSYYAIYTRGGGHRLGDYLDLTEISTPAAPSNTHGRLFTRDNAGKTELCVRFATGSVIVLATEP